MHKEMEAKACHSALTSPPRSPALTQHVGGLNHVGVQVSPVQSLVGVINGEVVGPAHLVYQCHTIGPIHEGPHDPWLATPLGPVDIAGRGEGLGLVESWLNTQYKAERNHDLLDLTLLPWGKLVSHISQVSKKEPALS